ncbi:MAG TPA: MBL fold metallo-hydrolase [Candidatus Omnitrophota bacterium]|nr:MBL fold metallo-hydrolase [Candidatus Omnitrophota bacterium]
MKKQAFYFLALVLIFFAASNLGCQKTKGAFLWWGCDYVELDISGVKVLIDPYGGIPRKANLLLITHSHADHCHVPTLRNVLAISGKATELALGSSQCAACFDQIPGIEKKLVAKGETVHYKNLLIQAWPSVEGEAGISYFIRDGQTGISFLHLGDHNSYIRDFQGMPPVDYLFLAMGKMSLEDMIATLKDIRPKYLAPIHYMTQGWAPQYGFPSPADPARYIADLEKRIKSENISTQLLILKTGEPFRLT